MPFTVYTVEDAEQQLAQLYIDCPELHQDITASSNDIDRRLRFPNRIPPFHAMARRPRRRWLCVSPLRVTYEVDEKGQEVTILAYEMDIRIFRP